MIQDRTAFEATPGDAVIAPKPSYADVSERILHEFEPSHGLIAISEILRGARAGLGSISPRVTPEAFDALVRDELTALSRAIPPVRTA
ncbi:MAG TPA: hypothetical protein VGM60_14005 [Pseudonocardia sp.]|jgi:hypothetical protein|uniref:hypothetical protein n=1 Tax=Pseudonocardia sp. TaxID=60912 RepID=UPI002F3F4B94